MFSAGYLDNSNDTAFTLLTIFKFSVHSAFLFFLLDLKTVTCFANQT